MSILLSCQSISFSTLAFHSYLFSPVSLLPRPSLLTEYLPCAGHGECEVYTGTCVCEKGFKGIACDDNRDNEDISVVFHEGPFFNASVLKVDLATREENAPFFNLFSARINDKEITTIKGNRDLLHHGRIILSDPFFSLSSLSSSGKEGIIVGNEVISYENQEPAHVSFFVLCFSLSLTMLSFAFLLSIVC
jgi:hypothetical protein